MKNTDRNKTILNTLNKLTGDDWHIAYGYSIERLNDHVEEIPVRIVRALHHGSCPTSGWVLEAVYFDKDVPTLIAHKEPTLPHDIKLERVYNPDYPGCVLYYIDNDQNLNKLENYFEQRAAFAQGATAGILADKLPQDVAKIVGSYMDKEASILEKINKSARKGGKAEQIILERKIQDNARQF